MSVVTAPCRSWCMRRRLTDGWRWAPRPRHHGLVLSFRLMGIPIRVNASFLLVAVLIGLSGRSLSRMLIWVAVVFVSILIHEMGHALTARAYGAEVAIELNAIGGLTSWSGEEAEMTPGRRAAIAAAGSGVGVAFGGAIWLLARATGPYFGLVGYTISILVLVNVFWGLLNWLPLRPLDGGHLFQSLLEKVAPRHTGRVAGIVFFLTAAAALVVAIRFRLFLVALLAGWLLLNELGGSRPRRPRAPLPPMTFGDQEEEGGEVADPAEER